MMVRTALKIIYLSLMASSFVYCGQVRFRHQVNVRGMSGERQISIWAWHWWTWNLFTLPLTNCRYLTPDMKCGAGLVTALGSQETLLFFWPSRIHRLLGWGWGTCSSSLQMLRWTKCPHLSLNLNIPVSLRTEVNQCNNCCEAILEKPLSCSK